MTGRVRRATRTTTGDVKIGPRLPPNVYRTVILVVQLCLFNDATGSTFISLVLPGTVGVSPAPTDGPSPDPDEVVCHVPCIVDQSTCLARVALN